MENSHVCDASVRKGDGGVKQAHNIGGTTYENIFFYSSFVQSCQQTLFLRNAGISYVK